MIFLIVFAMLTYDDKLDAQDNDLDTGLVTLAGLEVAAELGILVAVLTKAGLV